MANLSGGVYITFQKPYLNKVSDIISKKQKLSFGDGTSQVINMTKEIQQFISFVKQKNETNVKNLLQAGSGKYATIFNGYKWTDIDKSQFTGKSGGSSDAITTAMQERASLFSIKVGIEKNGIQDQKKFISEYRDELLKIYPDMDEEWENTFFEQQKLTQTKVGNTKYNHYSRDDGFMQWITDFVKEKYQINQKDTWNPADIWLVADYDKAIKILKDKIIDDVTSIEQFNAILRDMFKQRQVVGISLKKMSGKFARWELVNMDKFDLFDNDEYTFELEKIDCNCSLKNPKEFKTSDSTITLKSKKQNIKFQIRQNSTGFNNLKIEGTDISATSARLGKAPLEMVKKVFSSFNLKFDNDNKNFPKSSQDFLKSFDDWNKIFTGIKKYTNLRNSEEFKENFLKIYDSNRPDFAHSKLMQIKLINEILKLNDKQLNLLLTTLAFLAQKKGNVFGPFGKLY